MIPAVIIAISSHHSYEYNENPNVRMCEGAQTGTGTRVSTSTGSHSICYQHYRVRTLALCFRVEGGERGCGDSNLPSRFSIHIGLG